MKPSSYGIAVIAMLLLSCGRASENKQLAVSDIAMSEPAPAALQKQSPDTKAEESQLSPQSGTPVVPDWDKKIIKTAKLTLELKDYKAFDNTIHKGLKAFGAYIAAENQSNTDYRLNNLVTIKVPVDQFDNLLGSFAGEGIKVIEKNITTEDVTGEIIDVKARIEAKKQVCDRYLDLLKQAKNMKDVLAVQQEINAVQEEVEAAAGRAGYLTHQAAYSTIHLTYYQLLDGYTEKDATPGFFTELKGAFKESFSIISGFLLIVVYGWPVWTILIVAIVLYKKRKQLRLKK